MTWIVPQSILSDYVLASGCSTSESEPLSNGLDSGLVLRVFVSGKPTPRPASWHGWKTRPWSRALFGAAICATSTPSRFAAWWTSSLRAYRVSHTQSQESSKATPTSEATAKTAPGRSRNSCESWKSVDPPWYSARTFLPGFEEDTSDQLERNYADWVTRSKTRSLSLRKRLERVINGSGCSSWPTPQANDSEKRGQVAFSRDNQACLPSQVTTWPTPDANCGDRGTTPRPVNSVGSNVNYAAASRQTPSARDQEGNGFRSGDRSDEAKLSGQAKTWPTPTARDHKSGQASQETLDRNSLPLNEVVLVYSPPAPTQTGEPSPSTSGRRLNPAFVAWLMGCPWWWTRAEQINFGAREMDAFRSSLRWRLSSFFSES